MTGGDRPQDPAAGTDADGVAARLHEEAEALLEPAVELRRRRHRHPELGLDLPVTQQAVLDGHLCTATVEATQPGYPVTVDDPAAVDHALGASERLLGEQRVLRMPTPVTGAEDWSFVLQRVAGSMVFLGAAPPGVERPEPNHSNRMVIGEVAMAAGIALHGAVALG